VSAVRILIVDDSQEWRKLFSDLLRKERVFDIVGEATDGIIALLMVEKVNPTVVVLDINMPRLNGIEAAKRIRNFCPDTKIVFVSGEGDQDIVNEALRIGASGFVRKPSVWRDLVNAINAVLRGEAFISPKTCAQSNVP
jgi:DNA-binding NarL/FixJ family response regulator